MDRLGYREDMKRGLVSALLLSGGLLSLGCVPALAVGPPGGDTYWARNQFVSEDSDGLLSMRASGRRMCFTEPMGYTFIGKRVKGSAYRGLVYGPQWSTRQRVVVKFERIDGTQLVTVKSRGIQWFGPDLFYRVSRAEFTKSQFGQEPTRILNVACNLDYGPDYP
jgi:hypothetical protein